MPKLIIEGWKVIDTVFDFDTHTIRPRTESDNGCFAGSQVPQEDDTVVISYNTFQFTPPRKPFIERLLDLFR